MFCPYCGNEMNDDYAFCPKCGKASIKETLDDSKGVSRTNGVEESKRHVEFPSDSEQDHIANLSDNRNRKTQLTDFRPILYFGLVVLFLTPIGLMIASGIRRQNNQQTAEVIEMESSKKDNREYKDESYNVIESTLTENSNDSDLNVGAEIVIEESERENVICAAYYHYDLSDESSTFLQELIQMLENHANVDEVNGLIYNKPRMNNLWDELCAFADEHKIDSQPDIEALNYSHDVHFFVFENYKIRLMYSVDEDFGFYLLIAVPQSDGEGYIYGYDYGEYPEYEYYYGECHDGTFNGAIEGTYYSVISSVIVQGNTKDGLRDGEWKEEAKGHYTGKCEFVQGQPRYERFYDDFENEESYGSGDRYDSSGKRYNYFDTCRIGTYQYNYIERDTYWGIGSLYLWWDWKYTVPKGNKVRLGF